MHPLSHVSHYMRQAPPWLLQLVVVCTFAASPLCLPALRLRSSTAGRSHGVAASFRPSNGQCSRGSSTRRFHAPPRRSWPLATCLLTILGLGSCAAHQFAVPLSTRGRKLAQVSVSSVSELNAAIGDSAVSKIVLAVGTYKLSSDMSADSAICISRAVTIEAEVPGSVVLDAKRRRRFFNIEFGGTAELIGLNITGGYVRVSALSFLEPARPAGSSDCSLPVCRTR